MEYCNKECKNKIYKNEFWKFLDVGNGVIMFRGVPAVTDPSSAVFIPNVYIDEQENGFEIKPLIPWGINVPSFQLIGTDDVETKITCTDCVPEKK